MEPSQVDIAVVGSVNVDLVASVARLPRPGETIHAVSYEQFVGGKGGNQAVAAARLGRSVAFVGLAGDDPEGRMARSALATESVDVTYLGLTAEAHTGRAIVLVDDNAENSIVVVGGANAGLSPQHLAKASHVLKGAGVVVAQLEIPTETVLEAARCATGTFILNPAPARPLPAELLDLVDVLVVNETEYEIVLGLPLPADPGAIPSRLSQRGVRCAVVITLGAKGALLCADGVVRSMAAPDVAVVDTTGAGDAFIGALADALSRAETLACATRWAVHAASLSVSARGATTGMPRDVDVAALLQAHSPPQEDLGLANASFPSEQ